MTSSGFPVCDHLKSTTKTAQWVWKLLSFENLFLCLKLVSRIWQPWSKKMNPLLWSGFKTPGGIDLTFRKLPAHTGSSLGQGKDVLIWLDTIQTLLRTDDVKVTSFKQRREVHCHFSENFGKLFPKSAREILSLDSKTSGEFPLNKKNCKKNCKKNGEESVA